MMSDRTAGEEGDTDGGDGDNGTDMPRSRDKITDKSRQKHTTKTPIIFGDKFY